MDILKTGKEWFKTVKKRFEGVYSDDWLDSIELFTQFLEMLELPARIAIWERFPLPAVVFALQFEMLFGIPAMFFVKACVLFDTAKPLPVLLIVWVDRWTVIALSVINATVLHSE